MPCVSTERVKVLVIEVINSSLDSGSSFEPLHSAGSEKIQIIKEFKFYSVSFFTKTSTPLSSPSSVTEVIS